MNRRKFRQLFQFKLRKSKRAGFRQRLFEVLERREMLAIDGWTNVLQPLSVLGDPQQEVSPLDALVVINEINGRRYSDSFGRLPVDAPTGERPPYYDVNCNGSVEPLDVLSVINHLNGGPKPLGWTQPTSDSQSGAGYVSAAACSPQIHEGDSFRTELVSAITLPNDQSAVQVAFMAPAFDTFSQNDIRDALEIEVTALDGSRILLPYAVDADASFNWSEGLPPIAGTGVEFVDRGSSMPSTATIHLAGMAAGTQLQVRLRLVNNDHDNNTSVRIRNVRLIDSSIEAPTSASLASPTLEPAPVDLGQMQDVTGGVSVHYGRTTLAADDNRLLTDVQLTNIGLQAFRGPLLLVIEQTTSLDVNALRPDGFTPAGQPYFQIDSSDGVLGIGQTSNPRAIAFLNDSGQRFEYRLKVLAGVNAPPSGFTSLPNTVIEAGAQYIYAAMASDPDGDSLRYSLVSSPTTAAIDAGTGLMLWSTTSNDLGSHRVVIRATDPHGRFVEQVYALEVRESLQNRPPIFVSDPVTDAIASSGFEITTVATGAGPAGIDVISGFRGPRLVSIHASDQTVGVYSGENNDRFDDVTTYSIGEPKPTDAIFQSGYALDVGLPDFVLAGDGNDVLGMDQGDFNGDGILDLVAITSSDPSGAAARASYSFAILLGDGDGNFRQPQIIPIATIASAFYKHLSAADLNGDGNLDVIVINETNGSATSILGNGDGTFGALRVQTLSVSMNDYRLADINNDGILDLYGRNFNRSAFGWLPGVGDGTYSDFIGVSGGGGGPANSGNYQTKPYQAVDLEGDGDLDFVFGSLDDSRIELWTNTGSENFVLAGTLVGLRHASTALQGVSDLRVADFTGDGHLDIFYGGTIRDGYSIYVGNPTPLSFTYQDASDKIGSFAGESNPAGDDRPLDIDGDGDLDLVMGNGHVGEKYAVRVLINGGSGFFTVTDYASVDFLGQHTEISQESLVTNTVAGVLVGDYNRDGVVDLLYYSRGDNDFNGVGIIPGTRPGEFYGSRTIDFPKDNEVLTADFNGDGIVDLLSMGSAIMFLGNGDGTFQPGFKAVSVFGLDAQIADFNQDGVLDIIASRSQGFYVALGNGDGTFNVSFNTPILGSFYGYSHISNGDFNNDGLPDIIARAGVEQFIDVWLNQASNPGTFVISLHLPILGAGTLTRGFQHAVAEGDFNEDGFLDFAAGSLLESDTSLNSLKIYSGGGNGTFTLTHEQATYNDAFLGDHYYPGELQSGDVNEDGHLDVVSFTTGGPVVHLGIGDGTFRFLDQYFSDLGDASYKDSYLVDMDEDGHLDMVQLVFGDSVNVRRGRGDGTFNDPIRLNSIGRTNSASFADLDHDGHLDLVYARRNTNGAQPFGEANLYFGVRDTLVDILAVDLNGDGNDEILAINEANDRLKLFVGDNLGGLTRQRDLLTGRAPRAVTTADLDGDGRLELITANRAGRSLSVFSGSVATGYMPIDFPLENGAIDVAAADLDGDGNPDLIALDDTVNALWIYTGNGTTILSTPVALALGDEASKLTLADATGDGLIDAIITLPESNRLMILPNAGLGFQPGIFGDPIYLTLSSSPSDVQAVDLNDDGHIDLIATLPSEDIVSVLFGRGGNQFAKAQQINVGSEPTRVGLADADEDGRTDLIVTNSGDNTASVIYNRFDPNEVYRYDSDAVDPDGDTVTFAIIDGPGGLIINSATGQLLWAASPDQVGVHDVTLSANDGRGGIATQSFKIQVDPARDNAAPLIATVPDTKIGAADTFTYQATAIDNDRDTIRYRLIDAPAGATIDPITGLIEWDARTDLAISTVSRSDGRIDISPNTQLQSPTFTSEGWFYFDNLPPSNGLTNFFTQSGTYSLGNRGNFALRLDLIHPNAGLKSVDIPFVTKADRWYHFALVVDDSARTVGVYVDGQEVYSAAIVESLKFDPEQNSQVGSSNSVGFLGIIDNFRHWTVVRAADEIREGLGRHYDGDTRLVLDYRFDDLNTFTVRDHSPAGNTGFRIINAAYPELAPGLANPGLHSFTIGVEDGRGGFDQQTFTLDILPELRGSIRGQAFSDLDSSGVRNGTEPALAGIHLFIDSNGNGYPDPSESQTTTDGSGNYQFVGLLPSQYAVRVSPLAGFETPAIGNVLVTANISRAVDLAMEQLELGQIQGQLRTEDLDAIAYWKVYADLDSDGELDAGEPIALSDRGGNFALSGLSAGNYTIRTELPAGWSTAVGTNGQAVNLAANAISTGNNFTLKPNNTSVTSGLHFVTTPTLAVEARQTFRYSSVAIGILTEAIRYDLSVAPEGMSIDPATGLVAWRPTTAQVGEHLVMLRATSASGSISLQDFTLTVTVPNTSPTLSQPSLHNQPQGVSPGFPTAYVGLVYAVNLSAQDAESQEFTYSLLSGPSAATLNATTGELRWTPTLAQVGNAIFSIEVRDSLGSATVVNATVQVVNAQPAATPYQVTLPRIQVGLGQDYLARVVGKDALGRPLTWSLQSGPTGMLVSENGTIRWSPGNSDLGSQSIVLQSADVAGGTSTTAYTLQVVGRLVNDPPVIISQPLTSTVLGSEYQYDLVVVDANSDPLSYALVQAPVGMSIHPTLGTIRWISAVDQLGESNVSVQVTDPDGATVEQTFKLKVSRAGGPPAITSIPSTEASVGIGYLYSITARDVEGDPLTFRLLAAPAGMNIVSTTGVISWTPTAGQLGQQEVAIEVSDGIGGAVTQAFAIRVSSGVSNLPPLISSSAPRFGAVGAPYAYILQATDPETTAITYSMGQAPTGMTINAFTGAVAWTPLAGQVGKFVVTLIATDAGGANAIESFELDILAANSQPTIISAAPLEVAGGALFTYQVIGRDVDLDQLTYTLTAAPVGAAIDTFGKITWPTTVALIGSHNFIVRISDPRGGVVSQSFTLSVIEDVVPPKVSLIENLGDANRNILPWQGPFVVYARAIDNVAIASLTLTANGQDIPLSAAGTATFTFEDWAFQQINATATATDTNGNVTIRTISFDYDFPFGWDGPGANDIPTVAITSPTDTAAVFGMVSITGTASHANFAGYKLSYRRVDELTYTQFFESTTAVVNGQLGVWDTSLLINDEYVIRVEAATNSGVVNIVDHNVGLSGELKLGNLQLSFTDMVIPVAGIPIEITRIYDTLHADREGDFGYGWRLEYRNTDLRVGLPKSGLEDIGIFSPMRSGVKVYLNVPGQGRQGFTFNPDVRVLPGWGGNNLVLARPRFTPDPGVTSTLSAGTSGYLQVNELGELFAPGGIPYNPASPDFGGAYVLTTRDGFTYRIDGVSGDLLSASDRNDNRLVFSNDGVKTADGSVAITIQRDLAGRIASITDGVHNQVRYQYSQGRLSAFTNATGARYTYRYGNQPHPLLDSIVDTVGTTILRAVYDAQGRLVSYSDAEGNRVDFEIDPNTLREVMVDALGNRTQLFSDPMGNPIRSIDAMGNTISRTFDSNGNLTSITDPLGNTTTYVNNAFGEAISIQDAMGGITRIRRNASGDALETISAMGRVLTTDFDAQGNAIRLSDPVGLATEITYDRRGNPVGFSGAATVESLVFNRFGAVTRQIDSSGLISDYDFSDSGDVLRSREHVGSVIHETVYAYDVSGRLIHQTNPDGGITRFEYNTAGELVATVSPLLQVTRYVYDVRGRLIQTVFPDSTPQTLSDNPRIVYEYDALGRLVKEIDELGFATEYVFDSVGRLIATILPDDTPLDASDNPRISAVYDALGRLLEDVDPRGNRTRYEYDALGNLVKTIAPDGAVSRYEYDSDSQRTLAIDPLGGRLTIEFDAAGRLVGSVDSTGVVIETVASAAAREVELIAQGRLSSQITRDAANRLTSTTDALGARWTYGYDEKGNLTETLSPEGVLTHHVFDWAKRSLGTERIDGSSNSRDFDVAGNLVRSTDFDGRSIDFVYDERNRLIEKRVDGQPPVRYAYDAASNLLSIVDSRGTMRFEYDARNRLITQTDPQSGTIEIAYDDNNNIVRMVHSGRTVDYVWDATNRLVSVATDGDVTGYQYDLIGRLIRLERPNGVVETHAYGANGRLASIALSNSAGEISSTSYDYLLSGSIARITERHGSDVYIKAYSYDVIGQLTQEVHESNGVINHAVRYAYDRDGNRIGMDTNGILTQFVYDALGRLSHTLSQGQRMDFEYDVSGRLTSERIDGALVRGYVWDAQDRLIAMDNDGDGQSDVEYRYDDFGDRVERREGTRSTIYTVHRLGVISQVVHERSDGEDAFLVYGNGLLARESGGETVYPHLDAHGTVTGTSGELGQFAMVPRLDAFGNRLDGSDSQLPFQQMDMDPASGFYYARARHYAPHLGRFVSPDPLPGNIGHSPTLNRYAYAHSNPVNRSDPSGYTTSFETLVTSAIQNIVSKGLNIYKTYQAAKTRGQIAQQLGWFVGAGVSYAMFEFWNDLRGGEFALPGKSGIELFEFSWKSDLWVKGFKISVDSKGKRKFEYDLGKLGGDASKTSVKLTFAFCGSKFCGGGAGLEYVIREIPESNLEIGPKEFDDSKGKFLSVKAFLELAAGYPEQHKDIPVDLMFTVKFKALSTFKYDIIFSGSNLYRSGRNQ